MTEKETPDLSTKKVEQINLSFQNLLLDGVSRLKALQQGSARNISEEESIAADIESKTREIEPPPGMDLFVQELEAVNIKASRFSQPIRDLKLSKIYGQFHFLGFTSGEKIRENELFLQKIDAQDGLVRAASTSDLGDKWYLNLFSPQVHIYAAVDQIKDLKTSAEPVPNHTLSIGNSTQRFHS